MLQVINFQETESKYSFCSWMYKHIEMYVLIAQRIPIKTNMETNHKESGVSHSTCSRDDLTSSTMDWLTSHHRI